MSRNPYNATVVKVLDDSTLVLNIGLTNGVEPNQVFLIYEIGEEIQDPDSGVSLGAIEIVKGRGKVYHIQDRLCTIKSSIAKKFTSDRRIIRKDPYSMMTGRFGVREEIVEEGETDIVPFEKPKVGDKARLL